MSTTITPSSAASVGGSHKDARFQTGASSHCTQPEPRKVERRMSKDYPSMGMTTTTNSGSGQVMEDWKEILRLQEEGSNGRRGGKYI